MTPPHDRQADDLGRGLEIAEWILHPGRLRNVLSALKQFCLRKPVEPVRAENSHQLFRRQEGATEKFRDVKSLQKFAAVHASIYNHFNHDRQLNRRENFNQNRSAALAEWRQLAA
jgi:hypothetical protein